jgi:hypothetical protein
MAGPSACNSKIYRKVERLRIVNYVVNTFTQYTSCQNTSLEFRPRHHAKSMNQRIPDTSDKYSFLP